MKIRMIIAAHKDYRMPEDPVYLPLLVGAAGKKGKSGLPDFQRDDTGENISEKNPYYSELTGLFWAWKNLEADWIGLVHYRRYFSRKFAPFSYFSRKDPFERILTGRELEELVQKTKVLVPKKRRYYIETLFSHYLHTHEAKPLEETIRMIREQYPQYAGSLRKVLQAKSGYMFNMMILPRDLLDAYCSWLFPILLELEKREEKEDQKRSAFASRFYGRISEILFNVWLEEQLRQGILQKDDIRELPWVYMEKIDRIKKITSFLGAKFFHRKYDQSF